jgi:glycosyltransferase involved in cell wall biosynthesis
MTNKGFDVLMVSSNGPEVPLVVATESCPHEVVYMTRTISPFQDIISLFQLCKVMIRFKPNIVHTHTPKAGLLGMIAAKITRVPIRFHTVAGLPLMETSGMIRYILTCMEKLTYFCATRVYVNSRALMDFMRSEKIGHGSKLVMLGSGSSNGIDLEYFNRNQIGINQVDALRKNAGTSPQGKVWLFIGRVVIDKGIVELVDAFCKMYERNMHDQLWIIGPDENKNSLPEHVHAKILTHPGIIKWGYQDDVRPFLVASFALVFPSYREGFPNVPLQAAAMGCPMILSNINGCNEIVKHEFNGMLVPKKDSESLFQAMNQLREDEVKCNLYTERSLELVNKNYQQSFVWEKIANEYLHSLNESKK